MEPVRGAGPGLSGAGDNGRGSARAPPPPPLPPPPAAATAAAAQAASSPRYCCKSSFLPPQPPPAGVSGTPSPPQARAPLRRLGRGAQRAAGAAGPRCGSGGRGPITGCVSGGRGRKARGTRSFWGSVDPGLGGVGVFPRAPPAWAFLGAQGAGPRPAARSFRGISVVTVERA